MLCVLCFHILFLAISVVLSVGTRHHKPPLCGGRASQARGMARRPRAGANRRSFFATLKRGVGVNPGPKPAD